MKNEMSTLYELTQQFNDISGANKELSEKALIEQYTYIREEFKEMASTFGDDYSSSLSLKVQMIEPLLDDCLDVIITVFGMLQKLENLGVDVGQAAIATALNNLSKYTPSTAIAYETVERKRLEGVQTKAIFNESENCYVVRNTNTGKVIKPFNFVSNDLSKYITQGVKDKYE